MALSGRDFNQEILKTKGLSWALVTSGDSLLTDPDRVKDVEDCQIVGLRQAIEVLADRLDDLCEMNESQNEDALRTLAERNRLEDENVRLRDEIARMRHKVAAE